MPKLSRRIALIVALAAALGMAALTSSAAYAQAPSAQEHDQENRQDASPNQPAGAVFAMTNVTARNRIVTYRRALDGTLTRVGSVRTRGRGTERIWIPREA